MAVKTFYDSYYSSQRVITIVEKDIMHKDEYFLLIKIYY
jgi:hypothetical protein